MNGTEEAAGATGIAIKPAPPSQGAEAKGEETPKKKKTFSFKKPSKLSGLAFRRNRKQGGMICLPRHPQRKGRSGGGGSVPAARKALPREGRLPLPESQEPQAKGAEAGAASKGGDTEEEGPRHRAIHCSGRRVALHQQAGRMSSWVGAGA